MKTKPGAVQGAQVRMGRFIVDILTGIGGHGGPRSMMVHPTLHPIFNTSDVGHARPDVAAAMSQGLSATNY
jgi:hypothetical protein